VMGGFDCAPRVRDRQSVEARMTVRRARRMRQV
jgi:hypothetical protein